MKTPESVTIVLHIHALSSRTLHILSDKCPMVLTDMLMLKRLGQLYYGTATLLNVAADTKVPYPEPGGKKGGAQQKLPAMMGAHSTIRQRKHFTFLNFQQVDKSPQNPLWIETIAM